MANKMGQGEERKKGTGNDTAQRPLTRSPLAFPISSFRHFSIAKPRCYRLFRQSQHFSTSFANHARIPGWVPHNFDSGLAHPWQ